MRSIELNMQLFHLLPLVCMALVANAQQQQQSSQVAAREQNKLGVSTSNQVATKTTTNNIKSIDKNKKLKSKTRCKYVKGAWSKCHSDGKLRGPLCCATVHTHTHTHI